MVKSPAIKRNAAVIHAGASAALRHARAELFATEAQLVISHESSAATKSRIEVADNRIVLGQSQHSALQTQKRHCRLQLIRHTDGLEARTQRLSLSQDTLLETSHKMEALRMRRCRTAEQLRARSHELGIQAERLAERRQQLRSLRAQVLITRLRIGPQQGRWPPMHERELALTAWRQRVARARQAREHMRRAALRFRASTLFAGFCKWQAACTRAVQRHSATRHTHALAKLQGVAEQRLQLQIGERKRIERVR